jgi:hypothetical protein
LHTALLPRHRSHQPSRTPVVVSGIIVGWLSAIRRSGEA